jgi:hypothetical protein
MIAVDAHAYAVENGSPLGGIIFSLILVIVFVGIVYAIIRIIKRR